MAGLTPCRRAGGDRLCHQLDFFPAQQDSDFAAPGCYASTRLEKGRRDDYIAAYLETYACWAKIANKLRHMWCDVIKDPEQWLAFARKVKQANRRRPAFQAEFAKTIPGWNKL
jgi:hypothetical protein